MAEEEKSKCPWMSLNETSKVLVRGISFTRTRAHTHTLVCYEGAYFDDRVYAEPVCVCVCVSIFLPFLCFKILFLLFEIDHLEQRLFLHSNEKLRKTDVAPSLDLLQNFRKN